MKTASRYYVVENKATNERRLVRATHPNHAIRHVAQNVFSVHVPTQDELIELAKIGAEQEVACNNNENP